jgi:hypothetical protein
MNKNLHDMLVGVLVLVAVLMAVKTNYWLPHVKHLNYLFNDNITIGLIAAVVILLTLYDCKLGIAFAFVVAVVAVNMQNEGFESLSNDMPHMTKSHTERKHTDKQHKNKQHTTMAEGFQNMAAPTNVIANKIEKQMQVPAPATCSATDFNTYSAGKNYHGFDVAGCRYDLENKTQNSTPYGPPLSWCATYNNNKLPVPFYPLNG